MYHDDKFSYSLLMILIGNVFGDVSLEIEYTYSEISRCFLTLFELIVIGDVKVSGFLEDENIFKLYGLMSKSIPKT